MNIIDIREATTTVIENPDFHPGLLPHGYDKYFTVTYDKSGAWALDAGSYVGLVPCVEDVIIQINPKVPVANLTHMLLRSGMLTRSFETPYEQTVPYQITEDSLESFFEALVTSFLRELDNIRIFGLLRVSFEQVSVTSRGEGRVAISEFTHTYPSTLGLEVPRVVTEHTIANAPNRLLYGTLDYLARTPMVILERSPILERLEYFKQLEGTRLTLEDIAEVEAYLEHSRLPTSRYYYAPALNLALLIMHNVGVTIGERADVTFKPLLIRTDVMFEKYIRSVCKESLQSTDVITLDGRRQPKHFYSLAPTSVVVEPDILLVSGGRTLTLIDVKYKGKPSSSDHWQMWAYLEAHEVNKGAFISVVDPERSSGPVVEDYSRGSRMVYDLSFDPAHIEASERAVAELIDELL